MDGESLKNMKGQGQINKPLKQQVAKPDSLENLTALIREKDEVTKTLENYVDFLKL